ncbi:MAG TPA: type VI secretion protein IcmF/TssM N-terminal domain-containing protein, partial [Bryobacteraceae bacterium]|nr:type VI secretion protein IcmF/TssM N-terminal domain-containing protein [Bryobacteraceae bacterium]
MHNIYLITSGSLVVYLVAAWAAGKFLGLSGSEFYVLFGILSAIGALGAAALIWWRMKQSSAAVAAPDSSAPEQTGPDEVDLLIRDADQKLSGARQARISNLPLIFVLGDQGTTKTSIVTNSGINAELLAGLERQDSQVAPTRSANLWFAGNAVLAEMSATVLADPTRWTRVIRRLRPGSLKSVVGGNAQAPRAALVCVSSEILTHPGAAESLANLSRNLHSRLGEISQHLGISFPVYVVFTKADRLPFF